ncbi:DUF1127 domain-containing protein [Azospirillum sp. sgz301742]
MEIAFSRPPRFSFAHAAASRLTAAVRRWWQWRIERWELLAMDERELRDIGLTRLDAKVHAGKPFWWP